MYLDYYSSGRDMEEVELKWLQVEMDSNFQLVKLL